MTPPSPAQAWMLGLSAPLEELNEHRHDVLGGGPRGGPATYWFLREIGCMTRHHLLGRLEEMLAAAADAELPAWELVRLAYRAGAGYVAYFLEADEAWAFLARAARIARARYDSWEAYGADYVTGRQDFQGGRGEGDDDEETAVARLLDSDASPWRIGPWGTAIRGAAPVVHRSRRLRVGAGRDYATIAEALRDAANGDVIAVGAGTYREALRPKVDVELVAEGRVTVEGARDHALFLDQVGVRARGIAWIGARKDRSAVGLRDGAVLRMEGGSVRSLTHGVTVYDRRTMAFVSDVVVKDTGGIGVTVFDRGWLRAERVQVIGAARSGISSEQGSYVHLEECRVRGAAEAGLLVLGASKAVAVSSSFEKIGLNNVQMDEGSLEMSACTIDGGGTGLLARGGTAAIDGLVIARTAKNGLELSGKARVRGSKITIEGARGSAVFVAGGELALARSRLEAPRFDGVTVVGGEAYVDETTVASPRRAAIWVEGKGRAHARKMTVRGGDIGACARPGACCSIDQSSIASTRLGIAAERARIAVEATRITDVSLHGVQANGGSLIGGRLEVRRAGNHPLLAVNGAVVALAASRLDGGEEVQAATDARLELRRSRLATTGAAALASHSGGRIELVDCEVVGGDNGAEAVDGRLETHGCLVRGVECAIATDGKSELRIEGGALVGGSEVVLDLDGATRARVTSTEIQPGKLGEHRVGDAARLSRSGCATTRKTKFRPLLDERIGPFSLALHPGGTYTLFTSDFRKLLGKRTTAFRRSHELNGHGVAEWVETLIAGDRALAARGRFELDPEAGMFAISSSDREALVALVATIRAALDG